MGGLSATNEFVSKNYGSSIFPHEFQSPNRVRTGSIFTYIHHDVSSMLPTSIFFGVAKKLAGA
jgi:hypothetical protein